MGGVDLFNRPSTADTGTRNDLDLYETPRFMVASLLHHHPIPKDALIFEPCVGDGAIARALKDAGYRFILTNDLDTRHEAELHENAASLPLWSHPSLATVDYVITNPPFNIAFPILEQAVQLARVGVAMLLRKTFLEPTAQRGPWFNVHPPTRVIGQPRHNFRGTGSDSCASDWCIWLRQSDDGLPPFIIDGDAKTRTIGAAHGA
jgi:hypothetical protein